MQLTALKLARLRQGLLQVDVAHAAHIARARFSELENGYIIPTDAELARVAFVLGVDATELESAVRAEQRARRARRGS
jgi:transcriptional regulator with XRE-family HTH domain